MTSLLESLTLESLERDPDPILARLRDEAPIAYSTSMNLWLVTRWDDVEYMDLDERRWTDPTKLDLRRAEGGHAAFALGQHRCLGEWLGRQEVAVGTERLFSRLPNLRLDTEGGDVELHGFEFRGPKALKVRWDV